MALIKQIVITVTYDEASIKTHLVLNGTASEQLDMLLTKGVQYAVEEGLLSPSRDEVVQSWDLEITTLEGGEVPQEVEQAQREMDSFNIAMNQFLVVEGSEEDEDDEDDEDDWGESR